MIDRCLKDRLLLVVEGKGQKRPMTNVIKYAFSDISG